MTTAYGQTWKVVPEAVTYGYSSNNLKELYGYSSNNLKELYGKATRFAKGTLQLEAQYPIMRGREHSRKHYLDPMFQLKYVSQQVLKRPLEAPFTIGRGILEFVAAVNAKREFAKNPSNYSWDAAQSTKA